jgi:hypothetical protein
MLLWFGSLHLFTTDTTHGIVNTTLVYYRAASASASFEFVRLAVCCSSGDQSGRDHRASLWAPMPSYDPKAQLWHLFYVQYSSTANNASGWYSNFDGQIAHAVSSVPGPAGIGGPYTNRGVVLKPDEHSQNWEGLQGTDSISPPFVLPDGRRWAAFYGSAETQIPASHQRPHIWWNGLAIAQSLGGKFVRVTPSSLVNFNGGGSENPVVTFIPKHKLYVAVFDDLHDEANGFGLSWSADGLTWATPAARVLVPGGTRTPMASILEEDGETLSVYYTAGAPERIWHGRFRLHLNNTVDVPRAGASGEAPEAEEDAVRVRVKHDDTSGSGAGVLLTAGWLAQAWCVDIARGDEDLFTYEEITYSSPDEYDEEHDKYDGDP